MNSRPHPARPGRAWWLYVLECADGTWYTGITNDLRRRLTRHANGTASRYTRSRRPVTLVHRERCSDRSSALRKERRIKALSRAQKQAYVKQKRARTAPTRKLAGSKEPNAADGPDQMPAQQAAAKGPDARRARTEE